MSSRSCFTNRVSDAVKDKLAKEATQITAKRMTDYTAGLKDGVDLILKLTSSANYEDGGFKIFQVDMIPVVHTEPVQMFNHDRPLGSPCVTLMDELWNKVSS
jgi:hypothetical protein